MIHDHLNYIYLYAKDMPVGKKREIGDKSSKQNDKKTALRKIACQKDSKLVFALRLSAKTLGNECSKNESEVGSRKTPRRGGILVEKNE
ncbi:MAG: hypothetical protein ACRBG0_25110 [Lewinella sp.]|uniref:hypothetical protein n=1 Tax=Lewinella sp. TaxID=2004506 RepID=UPI003D6AA2E2